MADLVITELFPKSLTGKDSEVRQFKDAVWDEVRSHGGKLEHFALESGIVSMAIDDESIAYGLKEGLEQIPGVRVEVYATPMEMFVQSFNNRRKQQR